MCSRARPKRHGQARNAARSQLQQASRQPQSHPRLGLAIHPHPILARANILGGRSRSADYWPAGRIPIFVRAKIIGNPAGGAGYIRDWRIDGVAGSDRRRPWFQTQIKPGHSPIRQTGKGVKQRWHAILGDDVVNAVRAGLAVPYSLPLAIDRNDSAFAICRNAEIMIDDDRA